ncbi:helix-turn-helix transcriptional regulator [Arthrobacter sp. EpRS71]|uniref:helix-turn-helix domain-containing protein n=1 Tax=Arthrobacter sp. EpRS71 TaxID=1743141 RepID=UPI0009E81204|nr:helix-turn-helix transcriptional regulator [Arthrobacter sp. EpRS71]
MTNSQSSQTLIQERESTPVGQQGLAAARLAMQVRAVLHRALEASSISQKDLAERLNVGESRVSQILSGNGNVQISTFAKMLRAIGYSVELLVVPADDSVPPLRDPKTRRNRRRGKKMHTDTVTVTRGGRSGVSTATINFLVPVEDNEAFYETTGLHAVTRRPALDTWEIDWDEVNWDAPLNPSAPGSRKDETHVK